MKELVEQQVEELHALHLMNVSELTEYEKKLVGIYCYRTKVLETGKPSKDGKFTTIVGSPYYKYLLQSLGIPSKTGINFRIIEDEEINWDVLKTTTKPSSLYVFEEAIKVFPEEYINIRDYKGLEGIMYTYISRGVSKPNITKSTSKFLHTEVEYQNPLKNELIPATPEEVMNAIFNYIALQKPLSNEVAAAILHPNFNALLSKFPRVTFDTASLIKSRIKEKYNLLTPIIHDNDKLMDEFSLAKQGKRIDRHSPK